ncbi:hypothetical protein C0Q70_04352 [Pomacea canaliculata]|uniref:Uncharacterized protein n=1 Tax=Pomacea canaliculata TaxID=400727 RepID=A0A2T7PVA8_POMCA|nr:hypothetical protein C0Q70_04352 [Pomacea canaliculata]
MFYKIQQRSNLGLLEAGQRRDYVYCARAGRWRLCRTQFPQRRHVLCCSCTRDTPRCSAVTCSAAPSSRQRCSDEMAGNKKTALAPKIIIILRSLRLARRR